MAVYSKRYPFCAEEGSGLTLLEAERAFHLLPDPPKVENLNDYIVMAVNGNENGFAFFLHAYEERLNRRIRGFLLREGFRNTEPDRLFEYKQACVQAMLEVLPGYDPNGGASFLTYAHHDIENAIKPEDSIVRIMRKHGKQSRPLPRPSTAANRQQKRIWPRR